MTNDTERPDPDLSTAAADEERLEGLMAKGDLDERARRAAREAVAVAKSEPEAGGEGPQPSSATPPPARREFWLRVLLLTNVVLVAALMALPGSKPEPSAQPAESPAANTAPGGEEAAPRPAPVVPPPRRAGVRPRGELWERAVRLAGRGRYAEAVTELERYLSSRPNMTDAERRLVYNQLAYYLVKDGRLDEAMRYERMSSQLMARTHLPEDLLRAARRAKKEGDLPGMRAAYARFLLQRKQVPPSLRAAFAEAYLELGESYRLEAERPPEKPPGEARETSAGGAEKSARTKAHEPGVRHEAAGGRGEGGK